MKPKTILLVEDEKGLVDLLQVRLESHGYKVEVAYDGEEGLRKMRDVKPALVVLDIMMPRMHGYDMLKAAKSSEDTKGIPILVLTALTAGKDASMSIKLGADGFITKPFEPGHLLSEIKRLIG
jgi:DNA-binding response OmpR family regulator